MTRHSFAETIEQTATLTLTASHYTLAPDAYGLDDGHAWAFAMVGLSSVDPQHRAEGYVRRHLNDGDEWPYYIAAKPTGCEDEYTAAGALREDSPHVEQITAHDAAAAVAEGRVLETYCEGDLTAYIFDTTDERDAAARAWEETAAEYAARVLEEDHGYAANTAESLGAAIAECWADRSGHGREHAENISRDDVAETMEKHEGAYDTAAEWAESVYFDDVEAVLERSGLPLEVWAAMRPNWRNVAQDAGSNGTGVTIYSGHAFRDN